MFYRTKEIYLEQVVSNAYYFAKQEKYNDFSNILYIYSKYLIISSREPDFKYSDLFSIIKKYEKINKEEVEKEIIVESTDDFLEDGQGLEPHKYIIKGRYDKLGKFHEKPSDIIYFENLIDEEKRDISEYNCSRLIVRNVEKNNESKLIDDETSIDLLLNREIVDTHIYFIGNQTLELTKETDEVLYELCIYWILGQLDVMDITDFLSYQLSHSFYSDKPSMIQYIKTLILKYKKEYNFVSKENLKAIKIWFALPPPPKPVNKKDAIEVTKSSKNKTQETILGSKANIIILFSAMKKSGILPKNITKADMSRLIHFAYGIPYNQLSKKWSEEINEVKMKVRTQDKKRKLEPIYNGLKLIEKYLEEEFYTNN